MGDGSYLEREESGVGLHGAYLERGGCGLHGSYLEREGGLLEIIRGRFMEQKCNWGIIP